MNLTLNALEPMLNTLKELLNLILRVEPICHFQELFILRFIEQGIEDSQKPDVKRLEYELRIHWFEASE